MRRHSPREPSPIIGSFPPPVKHFSRLRQGTSTGRKGSGYFLQPGGNHENRASEPSTLPIAFSRTVPLLLELVRRSEVTNANQVMPMHQQWSIEASRVATLRREPIVSSSCLLQEFGQELLAGLTAGGIIPAIPQFTRVRSKVVEHAVFVFHVVRQRPM